jgi:hypothetical protein
MWTHLCWSVSRKMICLSLHGTNTRIHEEKPIVHLVELSSTWREADFVILVITTDQILHDGTRLKESNLFAIFESISNGWNSMGHCLVDGN